MDLLLGESILLIAKVSNAAVNHSDAYQSYATVLAANADDLAKLMGSAFGNTTADEFRQEWTKQNANFIDYTIGVVTHNRDKADGAKAALTRQVVVLGDYMAKLVEFVDPTRFVSPLANQATAVEKLIDDAFAQEFAAMYADLNAAYIHASDVGDLMATRIVQKFADKFPGDLSLASVGRRVAVNDLLQEHAYLATMATDAAINARNAEKGPAFGALSTNAKAIGAAINAPSVGSVWSQEALAIEGYADHISAASRQALTETFVTQLASAAHVPANLASEEEAAMVTVIDDQRANAVQVVAGDDRAAATAMQPIADAISAQG
jgi:hypothetical protein